jgi:hypothetical protein
MYDLAADGNGVVFMTDLLHGVVYRIASGAMTTLAGSFGVPGSDDGQGGNARFTAPASPALDAAGNLFVKDGALVRRIAPDGTVTTVAGRAGSFGNRTGALPGSLSDGTKLDPLTFRERLAVGPDGVVYVESDKALLKLRLQ